MTIINIIIINNPIEIVKTININFCSGSSVFLVVVELLDVTVIVGIADGIIPFKQLESQLIFSIESGVLK